MKSLKPKIVNYFKNSFSPSTFKKILLVERDYLRLFKGVVKISFFSICLFLIQKQIPYFNTYDIEYVKTETNEKIVKALLPIEYIPTFFLPSCFAMMIYNEFMTPPEINYKRELIKTQDQGVISLDWVVKENDINNDKLLVILHGLTGGSETSYIREIVEEYKKIENFKIVVVNYRGVNETPLLTPNIYHAGYYDDIYHAMKYIKNLNPNLRCYALGTSMGANIFTKLFANHDDFNDYVKGFISVSNPINCYEVEKRNRGGILDYVLIKRSLKYVEKHNKVLSEIVDMEKLALIKNYRDFDRLVTLKFFKFDSVDDYYIQSSSINDVQHLKVPSLFLNARNDLLSPVDLLDLDSTFRKNPNLIMLLTKWGGHVCWFEGWVPKRWFIRKTLEYVDSLETIEKEKNSRGIANSLLKL